MSGVLVVFSFNCQVLSFKSKVDKEVGSVLLTQRVNSASVQRWLHIFVPLPLYQVSG